MYLRSLRELVWILGGSFLHSYCVRGMPFLGGEAWIYKAARFSNGHSSTSRRQGRVAGSAISFSCVSWVPPNYFYLGCYEPFGSERFAGRMFRWVPCECQFMSASSKVILLFMFKLPVVCFGQIADLIGTWSVSANRCVFSAVFMFSQTLIFLIYCFNV